MSRRASAGLLGLALLAPLPAQAQWQPFIGQLMLVPYNFCPNGWAEAAGQVLQISGNTALFALLGTTFGGNGKSTFALPDLRGRVPVGMGQGPGLTPRMLGEAAGQETVTLIQSQMPAHSHALIGDTQEADAKSPTGALLAAKQRTTAYRAGDAVAQTMLHGSSVGTTGGSQPHENMPPYLGMRWCIATEGVYPSVSFSAGAPAAVEPAAAEEPAAPAPRKRARRTAR